MPVPLVSEPSCRRDDILIRVQSIFLKWVKPSPAVMEVDVKECAITRRASLEDEIEIAGGRFSFLF